MVPNDAGKAAIWRNYDLVLTSNKELSGYMQCRACKAVLAYNSKKTGTSSLQSDCGQRNIGYFMVALMLG